MLGGVAEWGWTVVGRKEGTMAVVNEKLSEAPVTVMGVRKKRKEGGAEGGANGVQTLDAGLVRKKARIEPESVAPTDGVQVLGAGLVRKKPKT